MSNLINSTSESYHLTISDSYHTGADIVLHSGHAQGILSEITDNSISLIITSPHYNLGEEWEKRVSIEQYLNTFKPTIAELFRVLKN